MATKYKSYSFLYITLALAIVGFLVFYKFSNQNLKIYSLLFASILLTLILFFLLVVLLGNLNFRDGFLNFFIGDEGGYSLSRVQAVVWAVVIISYQLAVLFILINNKENALSHFQLVFSESALWLLALSLSSYIVVKGITVDKITKHPDRFKIRTPKISDILVGDNGLDFSRCQMAVWTLIGVFVFIANCYFFLYELQKSPVANVDALFRNMYDDNNNAQQGHPPFVPYLPWSFIVLMGLSQGVYIGKKLIPTFKLDDVKDAKQEELQQTFQQLSFKQHLLNNIISKTGNKAQSPLDLKNIEKMKDEINSTQQKMASIQKDIQDIEKLKQ